MIEVLEATYQEWYKVWLKFNTGESDVVDLKDLLHKYKAAAPLLDKNEFKKFYLDEWRLWHGLAALTLRRKVCTSEQLNTPVGYQNIRYENLDVWIRSIRLNIGIYN